MRTTNKTSEWATFLARPENKAKWAIGTLQTVLYVMNGGGMIGRSYAEQPKSAYRDMRAGRAPYPAKDIAKVQAWLIAMAEAYGLDPDSLPKMPDFPNCDVF